MSMAFCERCDRLIDTDHDPNAFCDAPDGSTEIICDSCQERAYDRHQENLMEDGPGPSLLDQQRAAYNIKHGIRS